MLIQNPDVGQMLREEAKLTTAEVASTSITPNVQAVVDVSSKNLPIKAFPISGTTSGILTAYAGKTGYRLLLTGFLFSYAKDATCDIANGTMNIAATIDGIAVSIARISVLTLTAQYDSVFVEFNRPLLIDENTNITTSSTYTAGTMVRALTLYGREVKQ